MTVGHGGTFTFVDLFAGIGGFHAAFAKLGGQCVYASEKDKAAAGVYRKAWPTDDEDGFEFTADITEDVDRIDDLTTLDDLAKMAAAGKGTISNKIPQNFDVLAAGFPCQAFSKSGHQKGVLDETRGTLFYNILRIVAERKPKIVFLENVRNLVGQRHRQTTFVTIVTALQSLGYVVSDVPTLISPHKIPADMGGGPQNRERVYILAIRADLLTHDDAPEPFSEFHYPKSWNPKKAWSLTQTELTDGAPAAITDEWLSANGDTARAERLRDLRALAQQHSVADAEWLAPWEALLAEVVRRRKLTRGAGRAPFPGHPIWLAAADPDWEGGERRAADERGQPWKHEFLDKSLRFVEGYTDEINAAGVLKQILGLPNSWRKLEWQAGDATSLDDCLIQLRPSGIRVKKATYTPALVAINQTPILGSERRRLTPYEAGRLQGFPDNVYEAMRDGNQLPGECYKQFGNAVHVGAVVYGLTQFLDHYFNEKPPTDPAVQAIWNRCLESPAGRSVTATTSDD